MSGKKNPRRTNSSARNKLRKRIAARQEPCALCGQPIDYSLPPGLPDSYELDEIVPVSRGGDPYDEDNVQPAHRRCNQRKGNRVAGEGLAGIGGGLFATTRKW